MPDQENFAQTTKMEDKHAGESLERACKIVWRFVDLE
jgi:hypothetical protein